MCLLTPERFTRIIQASNLFLQPVLRFVYYLTLLTELFGWFYLAGWSFYKIRTLKKKKIFFTVIFHNTTQVRPIGQLLSCIFS